MYQWTATGLLRPWELFAAARRLKYRLKTQDMQQWWHKRLVSASGQCRKYDSEPLGWMNRGYEAGAATTADNKIGGLGLTFQLTRVLGEKGPEGHNTLAAYGTVGRTEQRW